MACNSAGGCSPDGQNMTPTRACHRAAGHLSWRQNAPCRRKGWTGEGSPGLVVGYMLESQSAYVDGKSSIRVSTLHNLSSLTTKLLGQYRLHREYLSPPMDGVPTAHFSPAICSQGKVESVVLSYCRQASHQPYSTMHASPQGQKSPPTPLTMGMSCQAHPGRATVHTCFTAYANQHVRSQWRTQACARCNHQRAADLALSISAERQGVQLREAQRLYRLIPLAILVIVHRVCDRTPISILGPSASVIGRHPDDSHGPQEALIYSFNHETQP
nr:hypothetical protein CFP56_46602 [Quercus suber]